VFNVYLIPVEMRRKITASYQHRVVNLLSSELSSWLAWWMQTEVDKLVPNCRRTAWHVVTWWWAFLNFVWRQLHNNQWQT